MARHLLGRITCINDAAANYNSGDVIEVYWNDADQEIEADLNGVLVTSGGYILNREFGVRQGFFSGTSFQFYTAVGVQKNQNVPTYSTYQFCGVGGFFSTLNLTRFSFSESFPYFKQEVEYNSPYCSAQICDLDILGAVDVTRPTGDTTPDGSFTVRAYSTAGEVKLSLSPIFVYGLITPATEGTGDVWSQTFQNLPPGTYTIYAQDNRGCTDKYTFTLPVDFLASYGILYDYYFTNINGKQCKVEILERAYSGTKTELTYGGAIPVRHSLRGENAGAEVSIMASELQVDLVSITNKQFLDLVRNADEQKYLIKFYNDNGAGYELMFSGYMTPEVYVEPYEHTPYVGTITATDRLADLGSSDFALRSGNFSALEILAHCLQNLRLSKSIRICDNLFEDSMNQAATDDPWAQTYIDVKSFYNGGEPDDCYTVVQKLLRGKRAHLFSWGDYWYVMRTAERADNVNYREFNSQGSFVTNSTISTIIDFKQGPEQNRNVWVYGGNTISLEPIYKKVNVISRRQMKESLTNPFTEEFKVGNGFQGWTAVLNGDQGSWEAVKELLHISRIRAGAETGIFNKDIANTVMKIKPGIFGGFTGNQTTTRSFGGITFLKILDTSREFNKYYYKSNFMMGQGGKGDNQSGDSYIAFSGNIEYSNADRLVLEFGYYVAVIRDDYPYVNLQWSFRLGENTYLDVNGEWVEGADEEVKNILFVDSFNNDDVLAFNKEFPESQKTPISTTFELKLHYVDTLYYDLEVDTDVTTISEELAKESTDPDDAGRRFIVREKTSLQEGEDTWMYYYYELQRSNQDPSNPSIVKPNDDDIIQSVRWVLIKNVNLSLKTAESDTLFSDTIVDTLPNSEEVPEETTTTYDTGRDFNVREYDYEMEVFDADTNANNDENKVINYYKLSDGTPTQNWGGLPTTGDQRNRIQDMLAREMAQYYNNSKQRIQGTFRTDMQVAFFNSFREQSDANRVYMPVGLNIDWKTMRVSGDMIEVGSNDEQLIGSFSDGFSDGFDNGAVL